MAISVVDADAMQRSGQDGLMDLMTRTTSLQVQEDSPGINRIDMRGLVTGTITGDSADGWTHAMVGVYLDETPISQFGGNPDLKVFDLERIEVLKGPQGTQFGAGAMSGVIRYITQKPDATKFFGTAEGTLSQTSYGGTNYNVRGMVNVPIIADKLAFRGVVYRGEDSGYIDSVGMYDGIVKKNINNSKTSQFRGALRWNINPDITSDFSWTHERLKANGRDKGYGGLGLYKTSVIVPEGSSSNLDLFNNTTTWDVGPVMLSSSTSYLKRKFRYHDSQETYPAYYTGVLMPAGAKVYNNTKTWMQEFRAASNTDGPLQYNVGVYYENFKRYYSQDIPSKNVDELLVAAGARPEGYSSLDDGALTTDDFFWGYMNIRETQTAIYGEATYTPVTNLDLTAGVRYFDWNQHFYLYYAGYAGAIAPGVPSTVDHSTHETGFTPRFRVSYKPTDKLLLFAEAAKGYRYGGNNAPVPQALCSEGLAEEGITESAAAAFGSDSVWSYQVGAKSTLAGGRITANLSAFYINWNNVQTTREVPVCYYTFVENAGKIVSKGLEFDGSAALFKGFGITLNASYTDSTADGAIDNLSANDGDRAPYVPKWVIGGGVNYSTELENGRLFVESYWQYRSSFWNRFNHELENARETPSQDSLNVSVNYQTGPFEFGVFGKNLTNGTKYGSIDYNQRTSYYPGSTYVFYTRPRTFGLRGKVTF